MFGINETVYNTLLKYFKSNDKIFTVILFGSRAKGLQSLNSDIDLCVECSPNFKGTIVGEINDLIGIYSCDIVFSDSLNETIEAQILRDGIEIYKKQDPKS